jgi:hypothetical protein
VEGSHGNATPPASTNMQAVPGGFGRNASWRNGRDQADKVAEQRNHGSYKQNVRPKTDLVKLTHRKWQCPLCAKSGHSTALFDYLCHHMPWPRFHDPNPKVYSISHLAMRLMLSCRAVDRIAAQSYKPTFFVSFWRLPEKDKIHVVTDLGFHSALGAIWACGAGTVLFERP